MQIKSEENGIRIDAYLTKVTGKTRNFVKKMLDEKCVSVNGEVIKASYKVKQDDVIEYELPEVKTLDASAQDIPLDIRYEDDCLLVINKPYGMVVHPAPGNPDNTLVNAVMHHCEGKLSSINSVLRPGIVHRIDKDTSGLLVVAKTDEAHNHLCAQLKNHSMTRVYTAIINGHFKEHEGTVNAPIGRHNINRKKMAVTMKNSKEAVTHYQVVEEYRGYSLIKCKLETGRTHQIRVHMSYKGHPLLGDELYGDRNKLGVKRQMLHAGVLGFIHPTTGEYMCFESALPEDFEQVLNTLRSSYI